MRHRSRYRVFSFPAAEISSGEIYALDILDMMIEILEERKHERKVDNLIVKKVGSCMDNGFKISDQFSLGNNFYCVVFELQ